MKKFIVKDFGRNNSPSKVLLKFLHHYEIENERKRSEFKRYDFIRVKQQFEKPESVLKTPQKRSRSKRSAENLEKIQELLNGEESLSIGKAALKISVSPTTFWKMLRCNCKAKFYRQSAVPTWKNADNSAPGFLSSLTTSLKGSSGQMKNFTFYTKGPSAKMMVNGGKGTRMKSSKQMIATIRRSWCL